MSQHRTHDTEVELHGSHLTNYCKEVKPVHYKINLKTDVISTRFEGHVVIQLHLTEAVNEIYFHSVGLNLREITFRDNTNKNLKPAKVVELEHDEMVKLVFDQRLESGNGYLEIKYDGVLNDKQKGWYINKFFLKNEEHCFAVTHFEPFGARWVFPCFDEPEFKAHFEVSLQIPTNCNAISNTVEVDSGKVSGPMKTISFARTPLMATHHLAFVVGEFEHKELPIVDGVRMRIYMPAGTKHLADYSMEIFEKVYRCCCRCFNTTKYPLTKLDMILMPNYRFDAYGNMGLIYIKDDVLLLDTSNRKTAESFVHERQQTALLFASAIIRQWMDHLCTIRFWTQHWFNEGFAHFFKYVVVDKIYPEWKVLQYFSDKEITPALFGDMFPSGHPLEREHYGHFDEHHFYHHDGSKTHQHETKHHDDRKLLLNNYYYHDSNTVHKSAAIFRMIYQFVGEHNFFNALLKYQKEYSFKTVTANDFFDLLELESHKPIHTIVQTWTHKKGFPIVEVTGKVDHTGNYVVTLKQKSVLKYVKPSFGKHEYYDDELFNHWIIPVTISTVPVTGHCKDKNYAYFTEQDKEKYGMFDVVMNKEQIDVTIPEEIYRKNGGFVHVNPFHLGHFVTYYVDDIWAKKVYNTYNQKQWADNMFDRYGLLSDTYHLVKLGLYPVNYYFEMVKQYGAACNNENLICYNTWQFIFKSLYEIRNMLINYDNEHKDSKFMEHLNKFAQFIVKELNVKLFRGKMNIVDWPTTIATTETGCDRFYRQTLRSELVRYLITFRHPELCENVTKTFWSWYEKQTPVDRDLLWSAFVAVAMTNEDRVLDTFIKIYQNPELAHVKQHVIWAFGYFNKKEHVDKILNFAITQKIVTKEDSLEILRSLARWFPVGRDLTWQLFKNKFNHFEQHYNSDILAFHLIDKIMSSFVSEKSVHDVMEFFADKSYPYLESVVYKNTEYVHIKSNFFKRDYDVFQKYLANY